LGNGCFRVVEDNLAIRDNEMTEAERIDSDIAAFGDLMTFYGSEVVSHGGLTVGFVIALFTLFQVRSSFVVWVFEALLFVVVMGGVYVGLRIVWYGSLSGIVTTCTMTSYRTFLNTVAFGSVRYREYMPHSRVSLYASYVLRSTIENEDGEGWRQWYSGFWQRVIIGVILGSLSVVVTLLGGVKG
jgi:hypothetical protein